MKSSSYQLVMSAMFNGIKGDRPPTATPTSIACHDLMDITGVSFPKAQINSNAMAELALGARFPARLMRSIRRAEDDKLTAKVGVHWATEQVRDLLDNGVKGIHFFTLNKSRATLQIYESLGVRSL